MVDESRQDCVTEREVMELLETGGQRSSSASEWPKREHAQETVSSECVVIPLPGLGTLQLPKDVFEKHLLRPQAAKARSTSQETLLDAHQLEERTGISADWWAAQARERRVPFRKFGRFIRFDVEEILASEEFKRPSLANCLQSPRRTGGRSSSATSKSSRS